MDSILLKSYPQRTQKKNNPPGKQTNHRILSRMAAGLYRPRPSVQLAQQDPMAVCAEDNKHEVPVIERLPDVLSPGAFRGPMHLQTISIASPLQ
jgi:hypothetical protein